MPIAGTYIILAIGIVLEIMKKFDGCHYFSFDMLLEIIFRMLRKYVIILTHFRVFQYPCLCLVSASMSMSITTSVFMSVFASMSLSMTMFMFMFIFIYLFIFCNFCRRTDKFAKLA
jgi:hypothetical protein